MMGEFDRADIFIVEYIAKARQAIADNDALESDGKLICYEWEAKRLIESGVAPERLCVIPTKLPVGK